MLNLYKLQIFEVIVREGSFSAAAEQLYMTQSAVSQHVQDLENYLGAKLFNRGRRGVTLTRTGEKLYAHSFTIFSAVAEAERDVMDVGQIDEGQVEIGATPTVGSYLLPEWIRLFRQHYPNLTVSLKTETTSSIVEELTRRHLDIGVIEGEVDSEQHDNLKFISLKEINMQVIVGPDHPWWDKQSAQLAEFNGQPFAMRQPRSQTRKWLDDLFAQHEVIPTITAEYDSPESIKQSVLSGRCLSILPDYAVQREIDSGFIHTVAIEDLVLRRMLKLVYYANLPLSPVATAFLKTLADQFPQLTTES